MILCGFTGSGKSTLSKVDDSFIDLESSDFQWIYPNNSTLNKEQIKGAKGIPKNNNFIIDYVNEIQKLNEQGKIVLISSHKEVREELRNRNLTYSIATPNVSDKNTYIKRYKKRNNNKEFIEHMRSKYISYTSDLLEDTYAKSTFILTNGIFLSDIKEHIKKFN